MSFEHEEALYRLGQLAGEALPAIATAMLAAGYDAPPICVLATLERPTLREAGALFEAALATLPRPPLTDAAARHYLRRATLARVADGTVAPLEGATALWHVWRVTGQPADLTTFIYLADLWEEQPGDRPAIDAEIVATARELLAREPDPAASDAPAG